MYERYMQVHLTSVTQDNMQGTIERLIAYPKELIASDPDKYWCPQQFQSDDNSLGTRPLREHRAGDHTTSCTIKKVH